MFVRLMRQILIIGLILILAGCDGSGGETSLPVPEVTAAATRAPDSSTQEPTEIITAAALGRSLY